jgi:hypothetical protein
MQLELLVSKSSVCSWSCVDLQLREPRAGNAVQARNRDLFTYRLYRIQERVGNSTPCALNFMHVCTYTYVTDPLR